MLFHNTAPTPNTARRGATARGWGGVEAVTFFSGSSRARRLLRMDDLGRELRGLWPPTSMSEPTKQLRVRGHRVT